MIWFYNKITSIIKYINYIKSVHNNIIKIINNIMWKISKIHMKK